MGTILTPAYAVLGTLNLSYVEDSGVKWVTLTIAGLGSPTGTLAPVQKPRQAGAWAGLSYSAGRSTAVEGTVYAPTAALAADAVDRLLTAATLDLTTLKITTALRTDTLYVRRDGEVLITWVTANTFNYSVQFFSPDPRKFATPLSASTSEFATSGGLTVPFTVPFTISSSVSSGLITLTNTGNEIGPVLARIDGPVHSPIIAHTGSSGTQVFSMNITLVAGEYLLIDMEKRTVYANGTASRSGYVTSRVWSGFDPGINTWSFSAGSFDAAALLTITATPANK